MGVVRPLDEAAAPRIPRFEAIYREHAPTVLRWVRRLGGPGIDVEDLGQEIFLRVHRALPAFRGESQVRTWLYRIVVRVVMRHRRRRTPMAGEEAAGPSQHPTPEDEMGAREAEAILYRALDHLEPKQRALLVAFELEELTGTEIAAALRIKRSTLWVQLHRARLALQKELELQHVR